MTQQPRRPLPPIDFAALAAALLAQADTLVPMWLPGGQRAGHEWTCGSLQGGAGRSCSVNLHKGAWADFASGEQGGDLVSLYAAMHGLSMGKAAVQVARDHGLEDVAGVQREAGHVPSPAPVAPAPAPARQAPEGEGWECVTPVPVHAPPATFRHHARQLQDLDHKAEYRVGADLHGYVLRFRTSDGGKDTLPYTWCTSARDGASRWHWKTWAEPRPLYFPGHALPEGRTVVLVEGEKKADALHELLEATAPGVYCVAAWPGGCKAWKKANWAWLAGSTVLLWPDCDAKREPLTPAERKANPDKAAQQVLQAAKPLLPVRKQPGMAAQLGIGRLLVAEHGCQVQVLPIPAPLEVPDGWDCADALADGWDGARVLALFGACMPLPEEVDPEGSAPGPASPPVGTGGTGQGQGGGAAREGLAGAGDDEDAFEAHLQWLEQQLKLQRHELGVNRSLLIQALRKAPALCQTVGFDELRGGPCTRQPWPWREVAGPLGETDDLRLGDWLVRNYRIRAASRAALTEAVDTVADERRFHPVRDWLDGLEHDGKPRLQKWLVHVLGMDPGRLSARRLRYLGLVGQFILMGLVARVMSPGVKFDYSLVLEGVAGVGKSTFIKVLVGDEYFSDTHFDIGNGKDGMEQLDGIWAYELSEMTAFKRADSEQIKQFFSSTVDRYRGAYGKYVQPHPRQCLIFCTTNKRQYLYDLTGNRRFWPVWVGQPINLEWLRKWRGQLFAEAVALYRRQERFFPTHEEEDELFVPEQRLRLVETAVQSRLYELLTRDGSPGLEGKNSSEINVNTTFVTLHQLVAALGADAAKSSALLEGQIRGWLESQGWTQQRESVGQRRRGYRQPADWPPHIEDDGLEAPDAPYTQPMPMNPASPAQGPGHEPSDDEPF